jgi:hypothetical protein
MARFGDESNEREYARLHGIDIEEEEGTEVGPIECPRCHRETPRHEDHCVWCHFALTPDAIDDLQEQDDRFVESAAKAPSSEEVTDEEVSAEEVMEARELIRENPALRRVLLSNE